MEGIDSSSCGISAWLFVSRQVTNFVALDSDDKVIEAIDRKNAKEATNALCNDWRSLIRVQIMLHSLKTLLIDSDRAV